MTATPSPSPSFSPAEVAALLRASLETVKVEVHALGQEPLVWRPSPDAWCINEVIGHVIEAEERGFAGRVRLLLDQDEPFLPTWDQEAVAASRRDCERDGRELLEEFARLRLESVHMVARLTPDQLDRGGDHPDVGRLIVRDLLHEWVFHDRAHVQQILDNTRALMWPHMGSARRFSEPDA